MRAVRRWATGSVREVLSVAIDGILWAVKEEHEPVRVRLKEVLRIGERVSSEPEPPMTWTTWDGY